MNITSARYTDFYHFGKVVGDSYATSEILLIDSNDYSFCSFRMDMYSSNET